MAGHRSPERFQGLSEHGLSPTLQPWAQWLRQDAMIGDALAYWDGLRNGRLLPSRGDLDPEALIDFLGHSALLERPRPGTIRIRLAGGRLNAIMGLELRGMPLRALFDLNHRSRMVASADAALATPSVMLASLAERDGADRPSVQAILLPLTDSEGEARRALMVLGQGASRVPARSPCRWRVMDLGHIPLGPAPLLTQTPDAKVPATPRPMTGRGRPVLRVIEGGRA